VSFGRSSWFTEVKDQFFSQIQSATVDTMSTLLREPVSLRDGHLFLDGGCRLTRSELQCIIDCVCCCACYLLFLLFLCTTRTIFI